MGKNTKRNFALSDSDKATVIKICQLTNRKYMPCNEDILHKGKIRLVEGDDLKFKDILPIREARKMAKKVDLDLVVINQDMNPLICRIFDYKKHMIDVFRKEVIPKTDRYSRK